MSLENKIERFGTVNSPDGAKLSMALVPTKYLVYNKMNPNVMTDKQMAALEKNIEVNKYCELAVVFYDKKAKELAVIDGEHRLRTLSKSQKKVLVTLVEGGITRAQAFSGAYTFNKIRGSLDDGKVAKMIQFGCSEFSEKEMRRFLTMPKYEMDERLMHVGDTEGMSEEAIAEDAKSQLEAISSHQKELKSQPISSMGQVFIVSMSKEEYKLVTDVLKSINQNTVKALVELCKKYKKKGK